MLKKKITKVNEKSRTLQHAIDRERLLHYIGRANIAVVQDDIDLTYVWDDDITPEDDNGGTVLYVENGGWRAIYDGPIDVRWFGAKGDGVTNDTEAIQKVIDATYEEFKSIGDRFYKTNTIFIPKGDYAVSNLLLKSGLNMDMDGVFVPYSDSGDVVRIVGNTITIDRLHLSAAKKSLFNGRLFAVDTGISEDYDIIKEVYWKNPHYVWIDSLSLIGRYGNDITAFDIDLVNTDDGMSWWNIKNIHIHDCKRAISINVDNGAYVTSNKFKGMINKAFESVTLENLGTGEISKNIFDLHIQPDTLAGTQGLKLSGNGGSNTFEGVIWDWNSAYGFMIYDSQTKGNIYSDGFYSPYYKSQIMIASIAAKDNGDQYETPEYFKALYHWGDDTRNGIGFQDNLVANLTDFGGFTSTPSSSTAYKMFTQPTGTNHRATFRWPEENGDGEIVFELTIPQARVHAIGIGFFQMSRIAKDIKIEYSNDNGSTWGTLENYTDNLSQTFLWRANGGQGYDLNKIRITFANGVDADDLTNLDIPVSNLLAVGSIAVFGVGKRKAFNGIAPYNEINLEHYDIVFGYTSDVDIITKNTIEFQRALDKGKAEDRIVVIPDKTIYINDTLVVECSLLGTSRTNTIIKYTNNGTETISEYTYKHYNTGIDLFTYERPDKEVLLIKGENLHIAYLNIIGYNDVANDDTLNLFYNLCCIRTLSYDDNGTRHHFNRGNMHDIKIRGFHTGMELAGWVNSFRDILVTSTIIGANLFEFNNNNLDINFENIKQPIRAYGCDSNVISNLLVEGFVTMFPSTFDAITGLTFNGVYSEGIGSEGFFKFGTLIPLDSSVDNNYLIDYYTQCADIHINAINNVIPNITYLILDKVDGITADLPISSSAIGINAYTKTDNSTNVEINTMRKQGNVVPVIKEVNDTININPNPVFGAGLSAYRVYTGNLIITDCEKENIPNINSISNIAKYTKQETDEELYLLNYFNADELPGDKYMCHIWIYIPNNEYIDLSPESSNISLDFSITDADHNTNYCTTTANKVLDFDKWILVSLETHLDSIPTIQRIRFTFEYNDEGFDTQTLYIGGIFYTNRGYNINDIIEHKYTKTKNGFINNENNLVLTRDLTSTYQVEFPVGLQIVNPDYDPTIHRSEKYMYLTNTVDGSRPDVNFSDYKYVYPVESQYSETLAISDGKLTLTYYPTNNEVLNFNTVLVINDDGTTTVVPVTITDNIADLNTNDYDGLSAKVQYMY